MKHSMLKNAITSNLTLKICSIIIGYCLWTFLSQSHVTDVTFSIPLYVYGSSDYAISEAPENILVCIRAKRSDFYQLDTQSLAVHINADKLPLGTKEILIKDKHLFLPQNISMIHCNPQKIKIITTVKT